MAFKVIIAGGRDFNDYELLRKKCDHILQGKKDVVIVSGNQRGADKLGEKYADERKLDKAIFPPNWDGRGKSAGPYRNILMGDYADALIAFPTNGPGTQRMIDYARRKKLPTRVIQSS